MCQLAVIVGSSQQLQTMVAVGLVNALPLHRPWKPYASIYQGSQCGMGWISLTLFHLFSCVLCAVQDLDPGDLVVTQDFKGAGLYTAIPDPDSRPFMKLKKNGRDSAGGCMLGWMLMECCCCKRMAVSCGSKLGGRGGVS